MKKRGGFLTLYVLLSFYETAYMYRMTTDSMKRLMQGWGRSEKNSEWQNKNKRRGTIYI